MKNKTGNSNKNMTAKDNDYNKEFISETYNINI